MDLGEKLITSLETSRRDSVAVLTDVIVNEAKRLELESQRSSPTSRKSDVSVDLTPDREYLIALESNLKAEFLPFYEIFKETKLRETAKKQDRKLWKYVAGTAGACEGMALIMAKRAALSPTIFLASLTFEAGLGAGMFFLAGKRNDWTVDFERSKLYDSFDAIQRKTKTEWQYSKLLQTQAIDDVLPAQVQQAFAPYARPEEFWKDYKKARDADLTIPKKDPDVPHFAAFIQYNDQKQLGMSAREVRWNKFYLVAQELCVYKYPGYVAGNIPAQRKR